MALDITTYYCCIFAAAGQKGSPMGDLEDSPSVKRVKHGNYSNLQYGLLNDLSKVKYNLILHGNLLFFLK